MGSFFNKNLKYVAIIGYLALDALKSVTKRSQIAVSRVLMEQVVIVSLKESKDVLLKTKK